MAMNNNTTMYLLWSFLILISASFVNSYCAEARLAEWENEYERDVEVVEEIIGIISGFKNGSRTNKYPKRLKRAVSFDDKDSRKGFKVNAASFIQKFKRTPSLGDCTFGNHKYQGSFAYTPFPLTSYKFSRKLDRIRQYTYSDIIGGAGVNIFGGLFGASGQVRVIKTVKKDKKSLTIFSHFAFQKGMISLVNPRVSSNWLSCSKFDKHYYLRDILTGMDDYLLVQLKFRSESIRKVVETKIKIKILFFSITATIRKIKTDFTSDFIVTVFRVRTFPRRREEKFRFGSADSGLQYIELLEKKRENILKDIEAAKYDDQRLHLEYYFMPCTIKTILSSLPFKPINSFVLMELVERTNEMESVLQDIRNIKTKATGKKKLDLQTLEDDIEKRLKKIGDWNKAKLSHSYVKRLLSLYGPDRAPYFYQRKLYQILNG